MADPIAPVDPPTLLESALQGERVPVVVLLLLVPLVSWTWIVLMARDMYGPMTGASAWMMTLQWDVEHLLLLWAVTSSRIALTRELADSIMGETSSCDASARWSAVAARLNAVQATR